MLPFCPSILLVIGPKCMLQNVLLTKFYSFSKNGHSEFVKDVCIVKSSPYFYSKKYLKHFITKLIAIDLKLQVKLKNFQL